MTIQRITLSIVAFIVSGLIIYLLIAWLLPAILKQPSLIISAVVGLIIGGFTYYKIGDKD